MVAWGESEDCDPHSRSAEELHFPNNYFVNLLLTTM